MRRDACFEVFAVDDFERNSQIVVKMITLDHTCKTPRQNMVGVQIHFQLCNYLYSFFCLCVYVCLYVLLLLYIWPFMYSDASPVVYRCMLAVRISAPVPVWDAVATFL